MTTDIEQRKSWAFIGTLIFISITVNASYAHVHNRYQNGSEFVQRLQQGQPPPGITAPAVPATEYASAPQPVSVSYTPAVERPDYIVQDAPPSSDFVTIQSSHREHIPNPEQQLQKQERQEQRKEAREEKLQAREETATNNIASLNTNVVETAKDSKRDRHEALSPKAKDHAPELAKEAHGTERTAKDSTPEIAREQGKNSERVGMGTMKKAVDSKVAVAPKETEHVNAPALEGEETGDPNSSTPPAKAVKTTSAAAATAKGDKAEKSRNEIKTPPSAPSQSVMNRIWRGFATGGQSGAEYGNQNSRRDSTQQQHEQNQNNENNGRGNGGGGGRRH